MKTEKLNEILKIVEHKVTMDLEWRSWSNPSVESAFDWLIDEIEEAKEELVAKKKVYLEDELWDVVWTILRIIELLDRDDSVDKSRIFDRVIKKYSERVYGLDEWKKWNDIKKIQKAELLEEQTNLENK
jgi:NTP pyrophosphatase (non-canonical NTP hydrolase)